MKSASGVLHPQFKLNGVSYAAIELGELAHGWIKEKSDSKKHIGNFLAAWLDEKPTIEIKTSGSTGKPKNILIRKKHMVNSALATGNFFNLKAGNSALLCLPSEYVAGKMMLVRAMVLGLEIDVIAPTSNPLKNSSKTYDFVAMVPLQVENSLSKIHKIKTLIVGGAPMSITLIEKLKGISTKVFETYGMTETATHVAIKAIDSDNDASFKALPKVSFSVDARDCLVINAPQIANGPITTNDIVELVSTSAFKWLGRFDSVINSGGVKLIPEQIEKKLKTVISTPFFVAGIDDMLLGQKLVLVIEGKPNKEGLKQKLNSFTSLHTYENPKEIYFLNAFCYTETGKINRSKTLVLLP